jgi:hypothetical protein
MINAPEYVATAVERISVFSSNLWMGRGLLSPLLME